MSTRGGVQAALLLMAIVGFCFGSSPAVPIRVAAVPDLAALQAQADFRCPVETHQPDTSPQMDEVPSLRRLVAVHAADVVAMRR